MKFTVEKKEFVQLLEVPLRATAKSNPILPMYARFMLELNNGELRVTSSDGGNSILATLHVDGAEDGVTSVDAQKLVDVCSAVHDGMVEFSSDAKDVVLRSVGRSGKYTIPSYSGEDFPRMANIEGDAFTLPSEVFSDMLSSVSYAVSANNLRPVLGCVCLDIKDGRMNVVATDGRMLSVAQRAISNNFERVALLPSKSVALLSRVLQQGGDVSVTLSDKCALITSGNISMSCTLTEGRYPNYMSVVPKDSTGSYVVPRQALLSSITGVMSCSDSVSNLLILGMKPDLLSLHSENKSVRTNAFDEVECKGNADFIIGANGQSLRTVLRNIKSDELSMSVASPVQPIVFRSSVADGFDTISVVMPMRISDN